MRILFIAPSAYLLGGVQDWLYTTVIGLRNRGHTVDVAVPNGYFHNGRKFNSYFVGLDADFFLNKSGTNEGRIRGLTRLLRRKETDIIVGVNIGNLFEAIRRMGKDHGRKFVMTIHAIEHNYYADINQYKSLLNGVIVTNKLSVLLAEQIGKIDKNKIYYAPYGIGQNERSSVKRQSHLPLMIAWVGRIEQNQKRVRDIRRVLEGLDSLEIDYKMVIAGDGPERNKLLEDISTWISAGKVNFHGFLGKEELGILYKSCHVLLITSEWETGPIVAWEAISCGLAVVSSSYTGLRAEETLINNKTALLFEVGDSTGAARQIARLKDEDLRQQLLFNAREIVIRKYSAEASLDAWEKALGEVNASEIKYESLEEKLVLESRKAGRMEKYLGVAGSELLRGVVPRRSARSAGDEWPHSLQGIRNQEWILEYAKNVEDSHWLT